MSPVTSKNHSQAPNGDVQAFGRPFDLRLGIAAFHAKVKQGIKIRLARYW